MGIAVATGDKTVFGRIAKLTNEPKTGVSTLEKEVLRFVVIIVSIMITMIVVVIVVWYMIMLQRFQLRTHSSIQGFLASQRLP